MVQVEASPVWEPFEALQSPLRLPLRSGESLAASLGYAPYLGFMDRSSPSSLIAPDLRRRCSDSKKRVECRQPPTNAVEPLLKYVVGIVVRDRRSPKVSIRSRCPTAIPRWSPRIAVMGVEPLHPRIGAFQSRFLHGARVSCRSQGFPWSTPERMSIVKRLLVFVRDELRHGASLLADHPVRCERHLPTAFGARGLCAVNEGVSPPAGIVVFNAPFRDLLVRRTGRLRPAPASPLLRDLPRRRRRC